MTSEIEIPVRMPEGQRQERTGEYVIMTVRLPAELHEMLTRKARLNDKSIAAMLVYYAWSGYHANQGTFEPPRKQVK